MPLGRNLQGGSNNEMSPPTEAIEEFKLQTGTIGAEYGGGQTAVANFVVKSGTNVFHGSGAYYWQDDSLDARKLREQGHGSAEAEARAPELGGRAGRALSRSPACTRAAIAASSSSPTKKRTKRICSPRRFARCPLREFTNGDFSRSAGSVYTGDARSGTVARHRRARPARALRPDLRSSLDTRRSTAGSSAIRSRTTRSRARCGTRCRATRLSRVCGMRRRSIACWTTSRRFPTCCPNFDQKTLAIEAGSGDRRAAQGVVLPRIASGASATTLRPTAMACRRAARRTCTSCRRPRAGCSARSENWVINDRLLHRMAFGYNRFGNDNRSVHFNQGWPSSHWPGRTCPTRPSRGWPSAARRCRARSASYGSTSRGLSHEGSTIFQDDLDDHQWPSQHQDRLRGAPLLRGQRSRRTPPRASTSTRRRRTCPASIS